MSRVRLSIAVLLVLMTLPLQAQHRSPYDAHATEQWRAQIETDLKSDTGWLTVAGLFFLERGANTVGTAPTSRVHLPAGTGAAHVATFDYDGRTVSVVPAPGADVLLNGQPLTARSALRADSRVHVGRVSLQLHRSGDRQAIRLRDPQSDIRRTFTTRTWFAIDTKWAITGRFIPFDTPRTIPGENILGDSTTTVSPGEVELTIEGQTIRLLAYRATRGLSFVLRDATANTTTYPIRFLTATAPDETGTVVIDFNRAYNPPCAFNPYTTCPVPPPQNRLSVAIPAGEKIYANR